MKEKSITGKRINSYKNDIHRRKTEFLNRLIDVLKFKSISADRAFEKDIKRCAEFVSSYLKRIGGNVKLITEFGKPIVYAEFIRDKSVPTAVIYGHYDVQPEGELSLWKSNPFSPMIEGKQLIARGSADNKGPFMAYLSAIDLRMRNGDLPINLKVIIEGEEESSGHGLFKFVEKRKKELSCDLVISTDAGGIMDGVPTIVYATRGIVYKQIDVYGPAQDLHSGSFGGPVQNPACALAIILSHLFDQKGKILIPGVYDRVMKLSRQEKSDFARIPMSVKKYCASLGISEIVCEKGFSLFEQVWCRPNLTVNGLISGYTGEGSKTVLPAKASAKISMRLVPNQKASEISRLMDAYIKKVTPAGVKTKISTFGLADPFLGNRSGRAMESAIETIETVFGQKPLLIREGGTLPIMTHFQKYLSDTILNLGIARNDCRAHGPNEYLNLDDYYRGIEMACLLFDSLERTL
jgi:acetylornithine deacetylase/succinyl-diaminopimelate desuccinylase-like protein